MAKFMVTVSKANTKPKEFLGKFKEDMAARCWAGVLLRTEQGSGCCVENLETGERWLKTPTSSWSKVGERTDYYIPSSRDR